MLVLTAFSDRPRILGALEAGACGYLLKDVAVRGGRRGHPRRGARRVAARPARRAHRARARAPSPTRSPALSAREREVLGAARRGPAEQADRAPPGDQREDRQVAPDADLPRARRHRPHAGGAVGRAPRPRPTDAGPTKVPLRCRTRHGGTMLVDPCASLEPRAAARPRCLRRARARRRRARTRQRGDDGDDARVNGTCGSGRDVAAPAQGRATARSASSSSSTAAARGERWRVVLVHERRVVWRGRARTRSGSGSFRIRRSVPDFAGADQVSVRASGPRGNTCQATTAVTGD